MSRRTPLRSFSFAGLVLPQRALSAAAVMAAQAHALLSSLCLAQVELAGSHAEMLCYFAARPHHESMRVETPVPRRSPSSLRRPPCNVILIFEVRACAVMSVYVLWVCGCGVCLQSACVVSLELLTTMDVGRWSISQTTRAAWTREVNPQGSRADSPHARDSRVTRHTDSQ